MPFAHAKWFVQDVDRYGVDWSFLLSPWTLAPLVLGVGAIGAAACRRRRRSAAEQPGAAGSGRDSGRSAVAMAALPQIVATAAGTTLILLALGHKLVLPDMRPTSDPLTLPLLIEEAVVGLWLVSGWRRALAGWALLFLSLDLLVAAPPLTLLEAGYIPGIAAYLVLCDRALRCRGPASASWRALAAGLGSSLVVVAFTEKLAVPGIGAAVLDAHPALDPLVGLGVAPPPDVFVRVAGLIEVFLGLLVATGLGGFVVPLAALPPFAATVAIFGAPELVGHTPIYAALVAIAARERPIAAAFALASVRGGPRR